MAAAFQRAASGRLRYKLAAEQHDKKRDALVEAWGEHGLARARVYKDANDVARMVTAPMVSVFALTPDCAAWSKMTHDAAKAAQAVEELKKKLAYAAAKQPRVIVMESVAELVDGGSREYGAQIRACLRDACGEDAGYEWYEEVVDPRTHAGVPMDRRRVFFVGVRKAGKKRARET